MYNGSIKCDHSQRNYTKTQVSLACNYHCVCGSSYISINNFKELVLIRIDALSNGYFGCQGRKSMFKHGGDNIGEKYTSRLWDVLRRALLGGFGGMLHRENFFKWCNLVRFGVYLDQILSLQNFKSYYFLYKK